MNKVLAKMSRKALFLVGLLFLATLLCIATQSPAFATLGALPLVFGLVSAIEPTFVEKNSRETDGVYKFLKSYWMEPERNGGTGPLVCVKAETFGRLTDPSAMEKITQSNQYPPNTDALWDLREMDFTRVDINYWRSIISIRKQYKERGNCTHRTHR